MMLLIKNKNYSFKSSNILKDMYYNMTYHTNYTKYNVMQ